MYVYILGCNQGDVRLVDGSIPYEGRVELCYNNRWSFVCEISWDADDARVVCRQLGYSVVGMFYLSTFICSNFMFKLS